MITEILCTKPIFTNSKKLPTAVVCIEAILENLDIFINNDFQNPKLLSPFYIYICGILND